MKSNQFMWELALMTFGGFMIMTAPTQGFYPAMIISGLFFVGLAILLIVVKKKKSDKK